MSPQSKTIWELEKRRNPFLRYTYNNVINIPNESSFTPTCYGHYFISSVLLKSVNLIKCKSFCKSVLFALQVKVTGLHMKNDTELKCVILLILNDSMDLTFSRSLFLTQMVPALLRFQLMKCCGRHHKDGGLSRS